MKEKKAKLVSVRGVKVPLEQALAGWLRSGILPNQDEEEERRKKTFTDFAWAERVESFGPNQILFILNVAREDPNFLEHLIKFALRYKSAVSEMSTDDVQKAIDLIRASEVMSA